MQAAIGAHFVVLAGWREWPTAGLIVAGGQLDLHGTKTLPHMTPLAADAEPGAKTVQVDQAVDWQVRSFCIPPLYSRCCWHS